MKVPCKEETLQIRKATPRSSSFLSWMPETDKKAWPREKTQHLSGHAWPEKTSPSYQKRGMAPKAAKRSEN